MLGHRPLAAADYRVILKRRRWIILISLMVFPVLAGFALFLIPPRYQSQSLIIIDQPKVSDQYVRSVVSAGLESRLQSMQEQILSRSRIQPIVERYNLYASGHMSMDDKVDLTRKAILVKAGANSMLRSGGLPGFLVLFTAPDARTAQLVCADITGLFINENLASRQASAEGTTDFLKSQLADAQRSLDEHDAKLAEFQRKYAGKLPGESVANTSLLSSIGTQLAAATEAVDRAEQEKSMQESMLASVTGTLANTSETSLTETVPNPQRLAKERELAELENAQTELSLHYTSDYPDVVRGRQRILDLRKQISQMPAVVRVGSAGTTGAHTDTSGVQQIRARILAAQADIASKRRMQQALQSQASQYQARIESSPQVEEEYKELDRGYQESKKFYDEIAGRMNSAKMATDLERRQEGEQFRVLDPANLPDTPEFPKPAVFIGGGVMLGLLVGLGISAFLEYRDTSVRNERDIWAFTQLPTLAVIGLIEESAGSDIPGRRFRFFKRKPAKEAIAGAV